MKQRFNHYMQDVRPSEPFLSSLESKMNRELRRKKQQKVALPRRAAVLAAAAALLFLGFVGVYFFRPTHADRQQSPVLAPGEALSSPAAAPTDSPSAAATAIPPAVSTDLEMLDEVVFRPRTDVNYTYGCHLLVNETAAVFNENDVVMLPPGTAYWTLIPGEENIPTDEGMTFVQWWDEATGKLCKGWADPPFVTEDPSPVTPLGIPGRVRSADVSMRMGASFRAPENAWLEEGQLLHLFGQKNGWIFASTAPFDQTGTDSVLPLCGWVYVGDLWGLRYENTVVTVPESQGAVIPADYPPEDEPWGLEIRAEGVWTSMPDVHVTAHGYQSAMAFENNLVGGGAHDDYVEVYDSPDEGAALLIELQPGDAFWPVNGVNVEIIYNEAGNNAGFAQKIMYLADDNALHEGWIIKLYSRTPKSTKKNPVQSVSRPGIVRADNTALRYGRSAEAPAVAVLNEGQALGLQAQVGNWIYASTELFCKNGEQPATGWIHVTEVIGVHWNVSLDHMELTVDSARVRATPDGKIIDTVSKTEASSGMLRYEGVTVPGKEGDWHFVSLYGFDSKGGPINGYIFADLTKLYTFPLSDYLSLENVVSATLKYSPTESYTNIEVREQTLTGEKLDALLERLGSAISEAVHTPVCADGVATLTLKYADGSEEITYISADSCTELRYGDVTYELRTKAERTEAFLNDGGVSLNDIFGPLFDEIVFP